MMPQDPTHKHVDINLQWGQGNSIMVSVFVCHAVHIRNRYDPFVSEGWNATNMLSTSPHQCQRLVHQRLSMCYHVYVIMQVKDPYLSVVTVRHCAPLADFRLSLYSLHVLNRDINMIQTNKQTNTNKLNHEKAVQTFANYTLGN